MIAGYLHMDQKVCLNLVKKDQLCAITLMNTKGFTQNGCYGNQPQPFEVGFYRVSANFLALLQNKI